MERRGYKRIKINAEGSFIIFFDETCVSEFVGHIVDISDNGIRISVIASEEENTDNLDAVIHEGCEIRFQAMESFSLYGREVTKIFRGEAHVVRKELRDGILVLGCEMKEVTDSMKRYLEERKVSKYMKQFSGN